MSSLGAQRRPWEGFSPAPQSPGLSLLLDDYDESGPSLPATPVSPSPASAGRRSGRRRRRGRGGRRRRTSPSLAPSSPQPSLWRRLVASITAIPSSPLFLHRLSPFLCRAAHCYLGFVFFSLLVEFTASIYSFSAQSGQMSPLAALYVAVVFSPVLLGVPGLKAAVQRRHCAILALSGVGFLAYFAHGHRARTWTIAAGLAASLIAFAQTWAGKPRASREKPQLALFSGLVLLLIVRFNCYSLNPVWYSAACAGSLAALTLLSAWVLHREEGWERAAAGAPPSKGGGYSALASGGAGRRGGHATPGSAAESPAAGAVGADPATPLAAAAASSSSSAAAAGRPSSSSVVSIRAPFALYYVHSQDVEEEEDADEEMAARRRPGAAEWVRVGASLGGTLFLTHLFFTGHGTVARWAGVDPFPYAVFVICSLTASVFFGASPCLQTGYTWALAVGGATVVSFARSGPLVVAGGCALALTLVPLWFSAVGAVSPKRAARTFFVCSTVYSLLVYLSLATVAYEWLPPGGLMRDRMWVPVYLALAAVGAGLGSSRLLTPVKLPPSRWWTSFPPLSAVWVVFLVALVGLVPATLVRSRGAVREGGSAPVLVVEPVGIVTVPGGPPAAPPGGGIPFGDLPVPLRAVQMNIQQGFGDGGLVNFYEVYDFLSAQDADLVALEETETNRIWCGNRDAVEFLSYRLQMHAFSGLPARSSTWGAAVLSRSPLTHSRARALPSSGEIAVLLDVGLTMNNGSRSAPLPLRAFVAHFGVDHADREGQGRALAREVARLPPDERVLALGDLNSEPHDEALAPLLRGNRSAGVQPLLRDAYAATHYGRYAPTTADRRTLDYIMFRGPVNCTAGFVSQSSRLSFHKPVLAVMVPLTS